jgi:very-short-patch-repair endonuclease
MNILILVILVAILLGILYFLKGKFNLNTFSEEKEQSDDYKHYVKKNYLMSIAEHEFYKVLKETIKDRYYIVPQVQLSKIIEVNKYEKNKRVYRNKIDRKSVDFVLFNKEYFTPYMVIELDDSSHMLPEREDRDSFVDSILNRVGIKVVHIPVSKNYDIKQVSDKINTLNI